MCQCDCVIFNQAHLQIGGCACVCVSVYCTDLNVRTRLFRSVEMLFMVRRRGPAMFLRLQCSNEEKDRKVDVTLLKEGEKGN